MKYTKLTNPFTHICCACGLTHKIHVKITPSGDLAYAFVGDTKRSIREGKKSPLWIQANKMSKKEFDYYEKFKTK